MATPSITAREKRTERRKKSIVKETMIAVNMNQK